jgi:hypothetical protein
LRLIIDRAGLRTDPVVLHNPMQEASSFHPTETTQCVRGSGIICRYDVESGRTLPIGATIFSRIRYNALEIDLGDGKRKALQTVSDVTCSKISA